MKLPSKLKIGGHWLDVEEKSEKEGYERAATIYRWWNKIHIQSDLAQSKKESHLFHEIVHEIDAQNQLDLSEKQVSTLGESLYQVLVDNGLLQP